MKNLTWNEFLSKCAIAWKTEGQKEKDVHFALLACEKKPNDTKIKIAAKAYETYKKQTE